MADNFQYATGATYCVSRALITKGEHLLKLAYMYVYMYVCASNYFSIQFPFQFQFTFTV